MSAFALLAAGVVVATPAHAVTCYGDYCSGQDPVSSGCANDAYVATVYNNSYFTLQVRYSPTCKTNWARLTMYSPGLIRCSHSGMLRAVQDTSYEQKKYFDSVCANTSVTRWTAMIYSPVRKVQGRFTDQNNVTYVTPWA
ncbi:DUF2690 domain-containing protein [Nocardia mangyaensis]|uniref:DUF2690 domain-containing protein n=1 Tax=Nocardia mangyaensis TaxID=2213200 RepID=UPI003460A219